MIKLSFAFDPNERPEKNIADFIAHIKKIDDRLGRFLEDNIEQILELGEDRRAKASLRTRINNGAVDLLLEKEGDSPHE